MKLLISKLSVTLVFIFSTQFVVFPKTSLAINGYSLRFYGNGVNDIDRVKIPIDNPQNDADVGGNFTLEFWMKANLADNTASATCSGFGWIYGNILLDRDIYGAGDYGDYGGSLN